MRLLQIDNQEGDEFSLVEFFKDIPPYAILSHTWGTNGTEVTYQDLVAGTGYNKPGYEKIRACGRQSAKTGLGYFWVDTCCIDKTSSAELSEAINSMYRWYEDAVICFAYIEDVTSDLTISEWSIRGNIRWLTRGWTLQELLAPREVEFFDSGWSTLGTRTKHAAQLSNFTGIHIEALQRQSAANRRGFGSRSRLKPVRSFSIAQRMSWAARRNTTRPEDVAYCLLGLFDVNMPLLYGEGLTKAFVRLQEEIMKDSNDQSLFAWCRPRTTQASDRVMSSLLAKSPFDFAYSGSFVPVIGSGTNSPYAMTNNGLRITLQMAQLKDSLHVALLDCVNISAPHLNLSQRDQGNVVALVLKSFSGDRYWRVAIESFDCLDIAIEHDLVEGRVRPYTYATSTGRMVCSNKTIYVPKSRPKYSHTDRYPHRGVYGFNTEALIIRDAIPLWQREVIFVFAAISIHLMLANILLVSILAIIYIPTMLGYLVLPLPVIFSPYLKEFVVQRTSLLTIPFLFSLLVSPFMALYSAYVSRRVMILFLDESFKEDKRSIVPFLAYAAYHAIAGFFHWAAKESPTVMKGFVPVCFYAMSLTSLSIYIILGRYSSTSAHQEGNGLTPVDGFALCIIVVIYLYREEYKSNH